MIISFKNIINEAGIEHNCPQFTGEMFDLFIEAIVEEKTGYQDLQNKGLNRLILDQLSPQDKYVLETEVPLEIKLSNGKTFKLEYLDNSPFIQARVQDLFGIKEHPCIGDGKLPLLFKLLTPANKVIQKAHDLPSLWGPSWELLRSDLRPRYPRHYWPDDPANAKPIRMKRFVT
jgi:ATP-dependent helicase HrpB